MASLRSMSRSTHTVTCRQFPKATNIQMLTMRLISMRKKRRIGSESSQMGLAVIGHTRERLCRENKLILPKRRQSSKTVASHVKTNYIVVWHKGYADLSALQHILLLAALPEDRVIRLLYFFRDNLPKVVQCGLEFLSSILFPTHSLRLSHYDALISSRKLALIILLVERLCNGNRTEDT